MERKDNPRKGCAALVLGRYRSAGLGNWIRQAWLPRPAYAPSTA
jgi:hypothetical protein